MEAIEVLLDLTVIIEKQIKKDNEIKDRVESLIKQTAKSEVLTEIYRKIEEVKNDI